MRWDQAHRISFVKSSWASGGVPAPYIGPQSYRCGKNVFQCFWSDPQTRVFECFWVSLCILDGKNVFQCFWSDPKTRVFECFSEVLYYFCHLGAARHRGCRYRVYLRIFLIMIKIIIVEVVFLFLIQCIWNIKYIRLLTRRLLIWLQYSTMYGYMRPVHLGSPQTAPASVRSVESWSN